jgi:hypothetical protein
LRKRTTPRLTFGEYDSPLPRKHTYSTARQLLMVRVRVIHPKMLKELRDDVFPLFRDCCETLPGGWLDHPIDFEAEHEAIGARITEWASRFHAEREEWLAAEALGTLNLWLRSQAALAELRWHSNAPPEILMNYTRDFEFSSARWEPEVVSWAQYSLHMRRTFEIALRSYEKEVREKTTALGRVPVQARYSQEDLDWLILYQFRGLTSVQIANLIAKSTAPSDASTILKGVKAAARLVGWTSLRQNPKGELS